MRLNDSKLHCRHFRSQSPGANVQEKSVNSRQRKVTRRVFLSFWNQFASLSIACFKEPKTRNENVVIYINKRVRL